MGGLGVIIRTSDGGRHWQVARGRGRRLAMLVIHVSAKTLPLGVVARDSAELGYRSRGVLITASSGQWRRADRTLRALGGQGVDAGWRLQLDAPDLAGDSERLQRTWQAATEEPEAAVQALVKHAETPLDAKVVRGNLAVFTTLLTGTKPLGMTDPMAMEKNFALLKEYTGFKTDLPATHFYTNEFVGQST